MSTWNTRLKCVEDYTISHNRGFSKGKVYNVDNGRIKYDDGSESFKYSSYEHFCNQNPMIGKVFIELNRDISEPSGSEVQIEQDELALYIYINDKVTIALPKDTVTGISSKHPEDEYCEEIGQALAFKRLHENLQRGDI